MSLLGQLVKAVVLVDFVRVHGRTPLTTDEFNEHHAAWLRAQGKSIEKKVKQKLKNLPTRLR